MVEFESRSAAGSQLWRSVVMDELVAALLCVSFGMIGWGLYLAYLAGRVLAKVEEQLKSHDRRLGQLESRAACRQSIATM